MAVAVLVVLIVGCAVSGLAIYNNLNNGIHRSAINTLEDNDSEPVGTTETSILVMGLDSRNDEEGEPLPPELYESLHAGDGSDGGYNANTLIYIHIPADGGRATAISIPRDDYVALSGAPDGVVMSKIKEAYGLALDERERELVGDGVNRKEAYQEARAHARQVQIQTVSEFLGDVRIDHFVEVTMAGFFSISRALQPITVCLVQATEDSYSGARFVAGVQQLDAEQAMSFVRQRRDTGPSDLNLTDLDRARRQQAFILSLVHQLKQSGQLARPEVLQSLLDVSRKYIALDENFNLIDLAGRANQLADGNLDFYTLPIEGFARRDGKDVNVVDPVAVKEFVSGILAPGAASSDAPVGPPVSGTPSVATNSDEFENTDEAAKALRSGGVPCVN